MVMITVKIDPKKLCKAIDPMTLEPVYEHMLWCQKNCRSRWYNQCEDYSYICIEDPRDALNFALKFSQFNDEKERCFLILKWS